MQGGYCRPVLRRILREIIEEVLLPSPVSLIMLDDTSVPEHQHSQRQSRRCKRASESLTEQRARDSSQVSLGDHS